ncbi:hypothetical protein SDC9_67620 [bioreactor metagenome]|uniref:Uncharacterized protein n=1 Tax=bioreactor metagenome TaxID=1076179 RepID=A0A644XZ52_9ZZZZ
MQEPCSRQQNGGVFEIIHMVEEKLGINVALCCREGKPTDGSFLVFGDIFSHQIQLAESVLCILIPLFCGSRQQLQGSLNILWHILAHEVNLAQPVLCKLIVLTGRPF